MDSNTGIPPEIVFLCTTIETKDRAVQLWDCIRRFDTTKIAEAPATVPAICCLIASEQLGNTVVSERRAVQLSQTTQEQFRVAMHQVQKLLITSKEPKTTVQPSLTLHSLVDKFASDTYALTRMLAIESTFKQACTNGKWAIDSEIVQVAIFVWSCRQFKIRTVTSIENLYEYYNFSFADFQEINCLLDKYCLPVPHASTNNIAIEKLLNPESPRPGEQQRQRESVDTYTSVGGLSIPSPVTFEDLAKEFDVGQDVLEGLRFLERIVRETADLTDTENWSSTMGRCVLFYWACSVLETPGPKQVILRNKYHLSKKEFDRTLTVLDTQRDDLRRGLETFYEKNSSRIVMPQITQSLVTSAQIIPSSPTLDVQNIVPAASPPPYDNFKKGTGKRGRPPKVRSPLTVIPMGPVSSSKNERTLSQLCAGRALTRGLLLLRSYNAKKRSASEPIQVPKKALPPLIALIASRQISDGQINQEQAFQLSGLSTTAFDSALNTVRTLIDVYETGSPFSLNTLFDDMALEHGLSVDVVLSMMEVREALKASQCLSEGMEWESTLVRCSVFFWTCAILKVPDVNQNLLRSRSLSSKRMFDSMLQLLNSHCSTIRSRLESSDFLIFAPPPQSSQTSQMGKEQDTCPDEADDRAAKRVKRETLTPLTAESDTAEAISHSQSRKVSKKSRLSSQISTPLEHGVDVPEGAKNSYHGSDSTHVPITITPLPPIDREPPAQIPMENRNNVLISIPSVCPSSEVGESKRRHTRYSTKDYKDIVHDRLKVWQPYGDEVADRQGQYKRWEEKMATDYGPQWEENIKHKPPGVPFE